ncbi:MAG TPA: acyl carrier protein [Stenomitos sp.]
MDQLLEEIRPLIAKSAKVDPQAIELDGDLFMEYGIDSLEGLKLLALLEQRYGITIPDHELLHLNTLGRIVEAIERARHSDGVVKEA